jgi:hypothetical protein
MSLIEYHKTTTRELLILTNKVRSLIDHWGEDGRYKEVVLKNIIKRFLPEKFTIGTGFVVKQTENRGDHMSSRQIDLIIYDDASAVLFKEGDFVIVTPDSVRAIIEVKANLYNQRLTDVVHRANENGQFIFSGKQNKSEQFFNGIFGYEGYEHGLNTMGIGVQVSEGDEGFRQQSSYKKFKVNHIALNKDWFLKYWPDDALPHSLYNITDLSFSFFISNLIDALANKSVKRNTFIWFATDKELNLAHAF